MPWRGPGAEVLAGHRSRGLALVELLIVMAIAGVVLGIVGAFFAQQAGLTRRIQGENELNSRLRTVAEAITQDFQLAGGRAIVDSSGRAKYLALQDLCSPGPTIPCVLGDPDLTDAVTFDLSIAYGSSLWIRDGESVDSAAARACRVVRYVLIGDALYRSDIPCGSEISRAAYSPKFADLFAAAISELHVEFVCSGATATVEDVAADCFNGGGFVREGRVSVNGTSPRVESGNPVTLAAAMPNMRPLFGSQAGE